MIVKILKIILKVYLGFIFFTLIVGLVLYITNHYSRKRELKSFAGKYRLDIKRTKLGNYNQNQEYYSRLKLEIREDETYKFNMSVPFIEDSAGIFYFLDVEQVWSTFVSGNVRVAQCTSLFKEGADSVIYLNGTIPKDNQEPVHIVYFIKE